jgi:hypothetical protein
MYLIKPCPACGTKLRFPINRGKIRVTCSCGNIFIADPDDPSLYNGAEFDLRAKGSEVKHSAQKFIRKFVNRCKSIKLGDIVPRIINRLYDIKYSIQNFKLLPGSEKRRVVLITTLIVIIIIALLYLIFHDQKSVEREKMII